MNKKLKLTIAIPALNEANNIKNVVESLLVQSTRYFTLDAIIIASDGSTDSTVAESKKIKSRKIKILDFKNRRGKAYRLSQIYKKINSDIVLIVDADLNIPSTNVVDSMVYPFVNNNNIYMTGGNSVPLSSENFVSNSIECTIRPYLKLRDSVDSLTIGPILAYRTSFAKKLRFPKDIYAEDIYSYLSCLSLGYEYKYCKDAIVYYRLPNTLQEHVYQNTKFVSSPMKMREFFPKSLMVREDYIPMKDLLLCMFQEFVYHPVHCIFIFGINLYCRLIAVFKANKLNSRWKIISSTKSLI